MVGHPLGRSLVATSLALLVAAGCGGADDADGTGGSGQGTSSTTSTTTVSTTSDPPGIDCPGKLDPLVPVAPIETVGDGTAASCTEAGLQAALAAVNASADGGSIVFDCGGPVTIALSSTLLVHKALFVDGGGEVTLSGQNAVRIFELELGPRLDFAIQRITLRDGLADESGAAILHPWYGTLTVVDVHFVNNHCTSLASDIGGGAVFAGGLTQAVFSGCTFDGNSASNGGGLLNRGSTLTVVDTTFAHNAALSSSDSGQYGNGGGLYIDGMDYEADGDFHMCGTVFDANHANTHGSAMFSYFYPGSQSFVDRCVFANNEFDGSPTGGAGGVYHEGVHLVLTASTFADNRSDQHAAGFFIGGTSSAEIINSTFSGNHVPEVGAAIFDGGSTVDITNCTFSGNDADYGPAIFKGQAAVITLKNSLFADNTTPNQFSALSCHESLGDGGGNLQWPQKKPSNADDMPCTAGITFADPLLAGLADNGGPTPTMALGPGSAAIDLASDCPAYDQRGAPRSSPCDAGAFEFGAAP